MNLFFSSVLSVGSSVDIVWNGGAQPWILSPENHFHKLKTEDTNLIEVKEKQSSKIPNGYYVYSVTCSTLGETKMELEVRLFVLFFSIFDTFTVFVEAKNG